MIIDGRARSLLALLLLGAHVWLAPFAHVDPPDPLWLGGIYDEADYDDVVLLVMAMTGIVETRPILESAAQPGVYVRPDLARLCPPIASLCARPIRAPPSA